MVYVTSIYNTLATSTPGHKLLPVCPGRKGKNAKEGYFRNPRETNLDQDEEENGWNGWNILEKIN